MFIAVLLGAGGIVGIIFSLRRYGWRASTRGKFGVGSFILLVGLGLIVASIIEGSIASGHAKDREQFDQALVKMFGRPPDKLDLQGDTLWDFHGLAQYGDKRYQLSVKIESMNDTRESFLVQATPVN